MDCPHGGGPPVPRLGKTGEVMGTHQQACCVGHATGIDLLPSVKREIAIEWCAVGVIPDQVLITLSHRPADGIEVVRHPSHAPHANVIRQACVYSVSQTTHRDRGDRRVEMTNLPFGMDAGVGATRRHRPHGAVRVEGSDGGLQGFLDAAVVGLALPAVEGGAVVLQCEGDPFQTFGFRPAR